jgi:ketosteroid isomerase-like protein
MRMTVWTAVLLGVVAAPRARAQSGPSPERQIAPLLDSQVVAANAHDTDRFLKYFLHDSTLVQVFNGEVTVGYPAVRALQLRWWNNGRSDVVYRRAAPPSYLVLDSGAVVVTEPLTAERTGADGKVARGTIAVTMIWQKRPEGWRVAYQHESTAR